MPNKKEEYYYIDLNVKTMKIVNWGISNTATLTGETDKEDVHRIFLTKGQYGKLVKYFD